MKISIPKPPVINSKDIQHRMEAANEEISAMIAANSSNIFKEFRSIKPPVVNMEALYEALEEDLATIRNGG